MEIKIDSDKMNKLLGRREIILDITYEGATPSRSDIRSESAKKFNLKEENVVIVSIDQLYGAGRSKALIHEYNDATAKEIAQKHTIDRPNAKKGAAAKAEAKPAAQEAKK